MTDAVVKVRGREVTVTDISAQFKSAADGIEHAIKVLEGYLKRFLNWRAARSSPRYEELRRDLPYFIHEVDADDRYILVNRDYKPIGVPSEDWEDYEKYAHMHIALAPAQIKAVVHPDHEHGIFGDGSTPWQRRADAQAYLVRLEKLLKMVRSQ
jgi:hypothetical protein